MLSPLRRTPPVVKARNPVKSGKIGKDGTSSTMAVVVEVDLTISLLSSKPIPPTYLLQSALLWPGTRCRGRIGCPTSYFFNCFRNLLLSNRLRRWASKGVAQTRFVLSSMELYGAYGCCFCWSERILSLLPTVHLQGLPFAFTIPMDIFCTMRYPP